MAKRFGLTSQCIEDIKNVFRLHSEIEEAVMFGSRAMGTYKKGSDIDIALKGSKVSFEVIGTVRTQLDELPYAYSYDIVNYHMVSNKSVVAHIDELGISFYKREEEPNKWRTYKLSEVLNLVGGGTPRTTVPEFWNGDIPWLSVVDFGNGLKKVYETEKTITEKGLNESSTKILKEGQIIISARGTVGELAVLGRDMALNQSCYGIYANEKTENDFLYYLLKDSIQKIKKNTHGAVFDTITKQTFENIDIIIPQSKITQRSIASILSSLDDKIELNLQMNQTLEAMAQAIFKEWFVNFNFPGFDGKLVDGLPEGWRKGSVLNIARLLSGGTPKTDIQEYWNGNIGWISAKDITSNNRRFILETEKYITKLGVEESAAKMLPAFTTIISARGTVGNYCILSREMAISQSNYGLKSKKDKDFFLFIMIENMIEMMKAYSYGTVFDTITTKTFQEMEIIIPKNEIIEQYEHTVSPIFKKILDNQKNVLTLTKTRDCLLPKLMTGKISLNYD